MVEKLHHGSGPARPDRVGRRPDPRAWDPDEIMTLPEATALLWPDGVVTVSTLRTAIRDGVLIPVRIGRRVFVTRRLLAALGRPCGVRE